MGHVEVRRVLGSGERVRGGCIWMLVGWVSVIAELRLLGCLEVLVVRVCLCVGCWWLSEVRCRCNRRSGLYERWVGCSVVWWDVGAWDEGAGV